jgi:hypothetical protein
MSQGRVRQGGTHTGVQTATGRSATTCTFAAQPTGAHTSSQTQHQVQRGLLLDVVVAQRAAILQLLASEDQALLIRGNTLLVLDLLLHVL